MKPSDILLAVLVAVMAGMLTVVGGVAVMLLSKRPQALPEIA